MSWLIVVFCTYDSSLEMLVLIAYAQMPPINAHAGVYNGALVVYLHFRSKPLMNR